MSYLIKRYTLSNCRHVDFASLKTLLKDQLWVTLITNNNCRKSHKMVALQIKYKYKA